MVKITVQNVLSKLENVPEAMNQILLQELSYELKTFSFDNKAEVKCLYNFKTGMTYSGLIPRILNILNKYNLFYELHDQRIVPVKNANFSILKEFTPRDYQTSIVDRINNRELIQAATGAGKTFIIAMLIEKFNVSPTVIVAPKVSLMIQIQEELGKFFGTKIGMVGGGHHDIQPITVVTPQSAPPELIKTAAALFWDEAHAIASKTIFNLSSKAINAYYRVGASATPWRDTGDDLLIEAVVNQLKPEYSLNASKLINIGKLVPCTINFININSATEWNGNYSETYTAAIVNNAQRNNIIINKAIDAYQNNKHPLILVSRVRHGYILLKAIKKLINYETYMIDGEEVGNIEFLSGEDTSEFRTAVFKAVRNGHCKILIGTTIADEGLDLPILDVLILAGAGKSSTKAFQRIGRVLRLYPNKIMAEVYDFIDSYTTFKRHAMTRIELYKTEPRWILKFL